MNNEICRVSLEERNHDTSHPVSSIFDCSDSPHDFNERGDECKTELMRRFSKHQEDAETRRENYRAELAITK